MKEEMYKEMDIVSGRKELSIEDIYYLEQEDVGKVRYLSIKENK